jgi:uncharacterized protein (DUF427 family)
MEYLKPATRVSWCEWKGQAAYYNVVVGQKQALNAAWYYPHPTPGYKLLSHYIAFYPGFMDACYVDGEQVQAQEGGFYGGWITRDIVGPFKGEPGTVGW